MFPMISRSERYGQSSRQSPVILKLSLRISLVREIILGSLRYRRFRSDGDVATQIDWVRGDRFCTTTKIVKILTTADLATSRSSLLRLIN